MTAPSTPVEASVEQALQAPGMLAGVDRLLVACSGGGDSVALAVLLAEIQPELDLTLLHCDHAARPDSGDDVTFVRELAGALGIACRVVDARVGSATGGSLEAAWRSARRDAYRGALADLNADAVALGHTQDDQAETVLLNLARGTGLRGLGGMRPRAEHDGMVLLRPLLAVSRESLRDLLRSRGTAWRTDPSNRELRFGRNRIRSRVLPEMDEVAPGAVANIARLAGIASDQQDLLDEQAAAAWALLERADEHPGARAVVLSELESLPRPLAVAVLQRALAEVRGDLTGLSKEHFDAVLGRVVAGQDRAVDLPGVRVRREADRLRLLPLENRVVAG